MVKRIRIKLIILIIFIGFSAKAQPEFSMKAIGNYELKGVKDKIEIPFEIHDGDILVKPTINGIPSRMYVDNGTLWDEVYFFGSSILDTLNLDYIADIEIGGAGSGDVIINKYAEELEVDFGNLCFKNQPAIISPPELGMQNYWKNVDGQISAQFFKHFITEIDYDRMIIVLHKPESFKASKKYTGIPMKSDGTGSFSIPIKIEMYEGLVLERNVILDLGGSCNFVYYFNKEDNIDFIEEGEYRVLGYGTQGEMKGYKKKVKGFSIANYKIKEPIGEFIRRVEKSENTSSIVGLEILSRFNTIFDYYNQILYIKPNRNFNKK
jgi:hypothetical protein